MNPQIRAVRAAERQLRGYPAALWGILRASEVVAPLQPALDWAASAPFDALAGAPAPGAAPGDAPAERKRGRAPEPGAAGVADRGSAGAVGAGVAAVRRTVEGIGEVLARAAGATDGGERQPGMAGGRREGAGAIGAALGGGAGSAIGEALAGRSGAGAGEGGPPVFSLGAIGRRAAARATAGLKPRSDRPEEARSAGSDSAGGGGPGPAGAGAVVTGVGVAAVEAAGAAATVVEALVPAMAGIARRLDTAGARLAQGRGAPAAGGAAAPHAAGERSPLATIAGAAARAVRGAADLAPAELEPNGPPKVEGQVEATSTGPVATAAPSSGVAPHVVDAEWVVAVVGDALLEQARRQGIDLT